MLSEKYSVFCVLCCETKFLLQYHDFLQRNHKK